MTDLEHILERANQNINDVIAVYAYGSRVYQNARKNSDYELNNDKRKPDIDFIISKILEEYDEMDNIVTQISVLVNKGASPDRDDIET